MAAEQRWLQLSEHRISFTRWPCTQNLLISLNTQPAPHSRLSGLCLLPPRVAMAAAGPPRRLRAAGGAAVEGGAGLVRGSPVLRGWSPALFCCCCSPSASSRKKKPSLITISTNPRVDGTCLITFLPRGAVCSAAWGGCLTKAGEWGAWALQIHLLRAAGPL